MNLGSYIIVFVLNFYLFMLFLIGLGLKDPDPIGVVCFSTIATVLFAVIARKEKSAKQRATRQTTRDLR